MPVGIHSCHDAFHKVGVLVFQLLQYGVNLVDDLALGVPDDFAVGVTFGRQPGYGRKRHPQLALGVKAAHYLLVIEAGAVVLEELGDIFSQGAVHLQVAEGRLEVGLTLY